MNALIPHHGEKGVANELALARIIQNLLPPSVGVGTGLVFDHKGNTSSQTDIVLFDLGQQPRLMAQTNQVMFPIETVRFMIEVKTTLTKKDIEEDYPKKRERLHTLTSNHAHIPPLGLFAYSFADSDFARAKELSDLADGNGPELACVITPGYVRTLGQSGFVPLRAREKGTEWQAPPEDTDEPTTIVNGTEYPVFMMGKYRGQRFVGDPGRALLMFCLSMLRHLETEGQFDWLDAYTSHDLNAVLPPR